MCQSIGGVTQNHAIKFFVQLAFGEKANAVIDAKSFDDLAKLCLRESWGPAFSHVSRNTEEFKEAKNSVKETIIQDCINGLFDMYCAYFQENFQENNKSEYLSKHLGEFKDKLFSCKETNSISVGHFQKLFNVTTKYLLALYLLRDCIWDNDGPFAKFDETDIKGFFEKAHCPIDSIILGKVYTTPNTKWSQFNDTAYSDVQDEISQKVYPLSNLFYDFENW